MGDEIRGLLTEAAPRPRASVDLERAVARGRSSKRRRLAARSAVAVIAVALAVGTFTWTRAPDASHHTLATQRGMSTYENASRGISLDYPPGWNIAPENLTPHLGSRTPAEIVSLGTYALHPNEDGVDCAQFPQRALSEMGPTDAFVSVEESVTYGPIERASIPPRPDKFGPETGTAIETYTNDFQECLGGPINGSAWTFGFQEAGRAFVVWVAIGSDASAQQRENAWQVLNSLRVKPVGT